MQPTGQGRVLDFAPIGMWWEITKTTADTGGEFFEAVNVLAPGFAGPPLHIHLMSDSYNSRPCCLTGKCYHAVHRLSRPVD